MRRVAFSGLALLVFVGVSPLAAQDSTRHRPDPFLRATTAFVEPASTGFGVYAENDVLGFSTDQNYTGGFAFSLGGRWVAESGITGPLSLLDRVSRMSRVHQAREVTLHTLTILGSAYTPRRADLAITTPILEDRPYASLFGFQTRRVSVIRKDDDLKRAKRAYTTELTIAALGWNLAKALQTDLHRSSRRRSGKSTPVDPLGWHNQISNGGEPTLLYSVGMEQLLAGVSPIKPGRFGQATWNARGSVGYYNNVAAGVAGRWGRISTNFWEFNSNPLSSVQQRSNATDDRRPWELFGFGAVRGKLVAYNVLMQGQFRESVHTFSWDQVNHALLEGEAGVVGATTLLGGTMSLRLMAAGHTPEFNGPRSRTHAWGAAHLSYAQRLPLLTQ
jgi:hypothetical protein